MMPAGQPPLDLAFRVQNWCWYWHIKALSGLSDDALDGRFAKDREGSVRTRAFYRVRSIGGSPCDTRGHRKNRSLFVAVHEDDAQASTFASAKADYHSVLWELLIQREISPHRLQQIIDALAERLGLTWITPAETSLMMELVEDDELLRALGFDTPRRPMLQLLAAQGDFDSLAFLCALYLEMVAARQLQQALVVAKAVTLCAMRVGVRMNLAPELAGLLERLVEDRVLRNVWLTEMDFLADAPVTTYRPAPGSEAGRRRQVRSFVRWYTSRHRQAGHLVEVRTPVADSPILRWIGDNRDRLLALRQELRDNEHQRRAYGDVPLSAWRDPAARLDARARQLRAELAETLRTVVSQFGFRRGLVPVLSGPVALA